MHTDLSPHLHTEQCQILIKQLQECHKNHAFRKFIGFCNDLDIALNKCLKKERLERRRLNQEKARLMQEKLKGSKPSA